MRKGKGQLTYKQLNDAYVRLLRENRKLRNDLNSRTVALNKALDGKGNADETNPV